MPISQDRILALLAEIKDWRDYVESIRNKAHSWARYRVMNGKLTAEDEESLLKSIGAVPQPDRTASAVENYHFAKYARFNDKKRDIMRKRRNAEDIAQVERQKVSRSINSPERMEVRAPMPTRTITTGYQAEPLIDPRDNFMDIEPSEEAMTEEEAKEALKIMNESAARFARGRGEG